jgi:hypothetical protein
MTQNSDGTATPRFAACHALMQDEIAIFEDAAWKQHCQAGGEMQRDEMNGSPEKWKQQVFIEKVVAMEEKHLFVCALQQSDDGSIPVLQCGNCGKTYPSSGYPQHCARCQSKLARWCLS